MADVTKKPAVAGPDASQESAERPIWEVILERVKDLPPEEAVRGPCDGAEEHDHYLYGTPKRNAANIH